MREELGGREGMREGEDRGGEPAECSALGPREKKASISEGGWQFQMLGLSSVGVFG